MLMIKLQGYPPTNRQRAEGMHGGKGILLRIINVHFYFIRA